MSDPETNKRVVIDYYQTAFDGYPREAAAAYLGDRYIQHNAGVADGAEAFIAIVEKMRAENPDFKLSIKRVIAEGDMVVTHSHLLLKQGEPGRALADFFRLENGKVVEHWDVIQEMPTRFSNANGMF